MEAEALKADDGDPIGMDSTRYGIAALRKFGAVPEGFHVYSAEWVGKDPSEWKTVRVSGAQFVGKKRVPHTTMTTLVTQEEMEGCAAESEAKIAAESTTRMAETPVPVGDVISMLLNTPCNGEQARVFAAATREIEQLRADLKRAQQRAAESTVDKAAGERSRRIGEAKSEQLDDEDTRLQVAKYRTELQQIATWASNCARSNSTDPAEWREDLQAMVDRTQRFLST